MKTPGRKCLGGLLAATPFAVSSPKALIAQTLSTKPASVSLTVVVPGHYPSAIAPVTDGGTRLVRRTTAAVDVDALLGAVDRLVSRIEVRLGAGWSADSGRVLVRDRAGEFQELDRDTTVVAGDAAVAGTSAIRFRIEPTRAMSASRLAVPVEYRLTLGSGDQFAVWSFSSLVRLDAAP